MQVARPEQPDPAVGPSKPGNIAYMQPEPVQLEQRFLKPEPVVPAAAIVAASLAVAVLSVGLPAPPEPARQHPIEQAMQPAAAVGQQQQGLQLAAAGQLQLSAAAAVPAAAGLPLLELVAAAQQKPVLLEQPDPQVLWLQEVLKAKQMSSRHQL